jgi:hypothetical protein
MKIRDGARLREEVFVEFAYLVSVVGSC